MCFNNKYFQANHVISIQIKYNILKKKKQKQILNKGNRQSYIQIVNDKEIGLSSMCILNMANKESLRLHKSINYQTQTDLRMLINSEKSNLLIHQKEISQKSRRNKWMAVLLTDMASCIGKWGEGWELLKEKERTKSVWWREKGGIIWRRFEGQRCGGDRRRQLRHVQMRDFRYWSER